MTKWGAFSFRSVHVNVWVLDDVIELFRHLGRAMSMPWALYDGAIGEWEVLLLFRKSDRADVLELYPTTISRLHAEALHARLDKCLDGVTQAVSGIAEEVAEVNRFVRGFKKVARSVPGGGAVSRWVKKG